MLLSKKQDEIYDLWSSNSKRKIIAIEPLKYPKVPLPHPGQSYNPQREDIKNLLLNIVENNRHKVEPEQPTKISMLLEEKKFEVEESDEESETPEEKFKISNNPAVDDTDRIPRKLRNKKHNSRLNILI